MRIKLSIGIAGIGLCLAGTAVPVVAHHAFSAEFDANKPIELTGTVTKMEWTNPHVWLHMEVKKPDESTSKWDLLKVVATIPGDQAFRPESEGNCPLVKK